MVAGAGAGRAADVVITRIPKTSMVWLGIRDGGAVKLAPDEARQLAQSLELVAGEADRVLEHLVDDDDG